MMAALEARLLERCLVVVRYMGYRSCEPCEKKLKPDPISHARTMPSHDSPDIMQMAHMHRIQLVFCMLPNSLRKRLVESLEEVLAALASSRASRNWRDSGRGARTIVAARENPAPMK
jgi:hypothetical protein